MFQTGKTITDSCKSRTDELIEQEKTWTLDAAEKAELDHCLISEVARGAGYSLKQVKMATVAEQLHLAREAKSLTVYQVAEVTKIRTDHIRALEEGNFDVFSAPVYIRGFVRTYATLLKLDVAEVMEALDAELGETEKFRDPPPLGETPNGALDFVTLQLSKLNLRIVLIGLAVVAGLALIVSIILVWRHHQQADPLANIQPGMYQPTKPSSPSGETLPLPQPKR